MSRKHEELKNINRIESFKMDYPVFLKQQVKLKNKWRETTLAIWFNIFDWNWRQHFYTYLKKILNLKEW